MRKKPISRLNLAVHLAAWIPLAVLVFDYFTNHLTVNPIQAAEQRTGKTALILLVLSLSITPLKMLTGWRNLIHLRRPLGVYAFGYALLHFVIFLWLDYGLDWEFLKEAVLEKPYALVGLTALLLLAPLAATSWRWWMKKLGTAWTRLHRLVYPAAMLVVIHYGWAKKGDFFRVRGDILQPLLFGLLVITLLVLRVPAVRRAVVRYRNRLAHRDNSQRHDFSPENKIEL